MMRYTLAPLAGLLLATAVPALRAADPLPSWNDGPTKKNIVEFVQRVTQPGGKDFVPLEQRIATFDHDGTLWCEHPLYVQVAFAADRIKFLAPLHPDWKAKLPLKALLAGDLKEVVESGEKGIAEIFVASHAGLTTDEFDKLVKDWLATAQHPRFKRKYTDLVYQPMLELLAYLRFNGFKTYIVSGGGVEFIRPWAERVYGIPPEQVIGSTVKTKFEMRNNIPVIVRMPELNFLDEKAGKPIAINQYIGRRPLCAFGNSDGDLQMLQWTHAGPGARFCLYVHHDDAQREYAYDRHSWIGKLDKGLDEAKTQGWTVASMKTDWKVIFPFEKK